MRNTIFIILCLLITIVAITSCTKPGKHRRLAEEHTQADRIDDAISHYRRHITERLAAKYKADGENPYFYHILIGDLYLNNSRPHEALAEYLIAKNNDVDRDLVVSRLRRVAIFYEEIGQYTAAIIVLKEFQEYDPKVFDATIDRVFRKQVQQEQDQQR